MTVSDGLDVFWMDEEIEREVVRLGAFEENTAVQFKEGFVLGNGEV